METKNFISLFKFSRPVYAGSSMIHFGLGLIVAEAIASVSPIAAVTNFFAMFCLVLFGYALNTVNDRDTDQCNNLKSKDNAFVFNARLKNDISKQAVLGYIAILPVLGLIIFIQSGWFHGLVVGVFIVLSFLYSARPFRLKGKPFVDILCITLGDLTIFLLGVLSARLNINDIVGLHTLFPILIAFSLFTFSFTLPTIISDISADKHVGLCTTAVFLGDKVSHVVTIIVSLFSLFLSSVLWYVSDSYIIAAIYAFFSISQVFMLGEYAINYFTNRAVFLNEINYEAIGYLGHGIGFLGLIIAIVLD